MFVPFTSGTVADHIVVPAAIPAPPVDVVQETSTTPTLSDAVPFTVIEEALVLTFVEDGLVIRSDGATVSAGA